MHRGCSRRARGNGAMTTAGPLSAPPRQAATRTSARRRRSSRGSLVDRSAQRGCRGGGLRTALGGHHRRHLGWVRARRPARCRADRRRPDRPSARPARCRTRSGLTGTTTTPLVARTRLDRASSSAHPHCCAARSSGPGRCHRSRCWPPSRRPARALSPRWDGWPRRSPGRAGGCSETASGSWRWTMTPASARRSGARVRRRRCSTRR